MTRSRTLALTIILTEAAASAAVSKQKACMAVGTGSCANETKNNLKVLLGGSDTEEMEYTRMVRKAQGEHMAGVTLTLILTVTLI